MATHFGADGAADAWSGRAGFLVFHAVLLMFTLAFFPGTAWLVRVLPPQLVNLPHRDYWLAPARRAETYGILAGLLAEHCAATMALLALMFQTVYEANLAAPEQPHLDSWPWVWIGVYLAFTTYWIIRLVRRFRVPGAARAGPTE